MLKNASNFPPRFIDINQEDNKFSDDLMEVRKFTDDRQLVIKKEEKRVGNNSKNGSNSCRKQIFILTLQEIIYYQ